VSLPEQRAVRLGLVGYGMGGRIFHAPFVEAGDGIELVGVVTRNEARRAEVAADFPGMPVFGSLTALLDAGVDAVTITTPPETRRALVLEAVSRGVHVVADKPFAPDESGAQELVDAARRAGVRLAVYQNRRWDVEIRTAVDLLASGRLGDPWRVHARFDLDEPGTLDAGPAGGLLRDLGAHLVDQMLFLLGPATSVSAHLDVVELPDGPTDAGFVVALQHASGAASYVEASKANRMTGKELRVYASRGSYRVAPADVQAAAVFAGRRPVEEGDGWGIDSEDRWGVLSTDAGQERVPSLPGRYQDYYTQFAAACRGEGPLPVTGEEGLRTVAVLDAARESAATGRTVAVG
jgi:predicted dehydrogenase